MIYPELVRNHVVMESHYTCPEAEHITAVRQLLHRLGKSLSQQQASPPVHGRQLRVVHAAFCEHDLVLLLCLCTRQPFLCLLSARAVGDKSPEGTVVLAIDVAICLAP